MQVTIKRTKGRKPFVTNKGLDKSGAPNFNFNVSHEVRARHTAVCGCTLCHEDMQVAASPRH